VSPPLRVFVTGTDTDVGKTRVAACLARAARSRGTVVAAKPVASGVTPGTAGEDAERLGAAAGHPPVVFATWEAPLSPHRAALLEGRPAPGDLLDRVRALEADTVIVEGAGGFLVPVSLDPPLWMEDLARAAGGRVLVVSADRLGTLNHTLLTVRAVRAAGLVPAAVALVRTRRDADGSSAFNATDLDRLLDVPVVRVPWFDGSDDPARESAVGADLLRVIV
jgi:dethiobiotin synthase